MNEEFLFCVYADPRASMARARARQPPAQRPKKKHGDEEAAHAHTNGGAPPRCCCVHSARCPVGACRLLNAGTPPPPRRQPRAPRRPPRRAKHLKLPQLWWRCGRRGAGGRRSARPREILGYARSAHPFETSPRSRAHAGGERTRGCTRAPNLDFRMPC